MYNPTIRLLREGHRNMQHVLTLVRAQVTTLRGAADLEGYTLLTNAIGYMHGYPGLVHHPTEEVIFTKLASASPSAHAVCVLLRDQHHEFVEQEADLLRYIREAQAGDQGAYEMLQKQTAAYCLAHADHIMTEEAEIFPSAEKCLSEPDWREALARFQGLTDPVFGGAELKRYESLYDYLVRSAHESTAKSAG